MATTASSTTGLLSEFGDSANNAIIKSRNAAGEICERRSRSDHRRMAGKAMTCSSGVRATTRCLAAWATISC
jgi:hypothetical protein